MSPPAPQHELAGAQVDIWASFIDEVAQQDLTARYWALLSEDERGQQGRFMFEKDRLRYLVTRALTRYVLSRYLPIAPEQWQFTPTAFGKPVIANDHPGVAGLEFNISHAGRVVLLAVTRGGPVGIDVEELHRNVPMQIAESVFCASEVQQLRALPAAQQVPRFLEFWTLKESYIKARGKGLSLPLDKFGFVIGTDPRESELSAHVDAELDDTASNWTFWQWRPSQDSIAALCVRHNGVAPTVTVRRTIALGSEEPMAFDVLRMCAP